MAPIKSSLARSVGKLLGVFRDRDTSLRGFASSRFKLPPIDASGGNAEYTLNGFKYHVFTSSGSLVINENSGTVDFLVVGGGGGAGAGASNDYGRSGGGGGAGGFRCSFTGITPGGPSASAESGLSLSPGTYPVTIGDGGGGFGSGPGDTPNNGGDSSFGPPSTPARVFASGGGRGAGGRSNAGTPSTGGSGGGASAQEQNGQPQSSFPGSPNLGGTASTENQGVNQIVAGYGGGRCGSESNTGGGGGGAGAAGEDGSDGDNALDGRAGAGKSVPTDMVPTSYGTTGPSPGRWFAQGGFASSENSGGAYDSAGGGGANPDHWTSSPGVNGAANTGGGGGGRGDSQTGGNGGSGIVILRYPV